jgi:hypothetical protein
MNTETDAATGLTNFVLIIVCLLLGAGIGHGLATWQVPDSDLALWTSTLLFPAAILLGWLLLLPLALVALPFALPGLIRRVGEPLAPHGAAETPPPPAKRSRLGWVFVLTSLPTSLLAGLIAGAPFVYLVCGLAYGYLLRHVDALLDVNVDLG